MADDSIGQLEEVVYRLVDKCRILQEQNTRLIQTHERWLEERRNMMQRLERVENCIDSSISQLQSMQGAE